MLRAGRRAPSDSDARRGEGEWHLTGGTDGKRFEKGNLA